MARPNKFRAKKQKIDGYTFDSQAEAGRYVELRAMQHRGDISNLRVHPVYMLSVTHDRPILIRSDHYTKGRHAKFTPDFDYVVEGRGIIVEDVKGVVTEAYRLRRAVFEAVYYPLRCDEIPARSKSWRAYKPKPKR
jgi:hypothetical protein